MTSAPSNLLPRPVKTNKRKRRKSKAKQELSSPPAAPIDLSIKTSDNTSKCSKQSCLKGSGETSKCSNQSCTDKNALPCLQTSTPSQPGIDCRQHDETNATKLNLEEGNMVNQTDNKKELSITPSSGYSLNQSDKTNTVLNDENNNLNETVENEPSVTPKMNIDVMEKRGTKSNVIGKPGGSVRPLEDQTLHYFHREYPELDPYVLCNKIKDQLARKFTMLSLKDIAKQELLKRVTETELEKMLVERNLNDKRNVDFNLLLETLSLKRKLHVTLPKLKKDVIQSWTKEKPSWYYIDPYSDIDIVNSADSGVSTDHETEPESVSTDHETKGKRTSGVHFDQIGGHVLRKRRRPYSSERIRRKSTETKFYRGMCNDSPKKKKPKTELLKPKYSGPSKSRLEAQDKIERRNYNMRNGLKDDVNKRLTQSYRMFQPNRNANDSDEDNAPDLPADTEKSDVKPSMEKETKEDTENVVKCDVKTHTVGIKKHYKNTSGRKHKCKECAFVTDSSAKLNTHHKDNHQPVKCDVCKELFNTPSTLARHVYKHRELKFKCEQCGKRFPFEGDRDLHLNTHRTIKSFRCANPSCNKSYFSKGELDKHAKTHDNITWKCKHCMYTNSDERNLKSHMRVHSALKRYLCPTCLQLFKYDTQLRRHLPCKSNVPVKGNDNKNTEPVKKSITKLKRSASPDY